MLGLLKEEYKIIIEEILNDKKELPDAKFEFSVVKSEYGYYLQVIVDDCNYSSYELDKDESEAVI